LQHVCGLVFGEGEISRELEKNITGRPSKESLPNDEKTLTKTEQLAARTEVVLIKHKYPELEAIVTGSRREPVKDTTPTLAEHKLGGLLKVMPKNEGALSRGSAREPRDGARVRPARSPWPLAHPRFRSGPGYYPDAGACIRIGEISRELETAEQAKGGRHPNDGKPTKTEQLAVAGISTSTA